MIANTTKRARQRQLKRILKLLEDHGEVNFFEAKAQRIDPAILVNEGNRLKRAGRAHWDSPYLKRGPQPHENTTWIN